MRVKCSDEHREVEYENKPSGIPVECPVCEVLTALWESEEDYEAAIAELEDQISRLEDEISELEDE